MVTERLTETDRAALERAIKLTLAEPDAGRVEQVRSMLEDDDWLEVAEFCSYHRQCRDLGLKPWESSPSWLAADPVELEGIIRSGPQHNRDFVAATVLHEMLALGLSKYDATPLASLERAKQRQHDSRLRA